MQVSVDNREGSLRGGLFEDGHGFVAEVLFPPGNPLIAQVFISGPNIKAMTNGLERLVAGEIARTGSLSKRRRGELRKNSYKLAISLLKPPQKTDYDVTSLMLTKNSRQHRGIADGVSPVTLATLRKTSGKAWVG